MDRLAEIKKRLTTALSPSNLEVVDESHLHAGHEGAKSGAGHFAVTIVSNAFKDCGLVDRHRKIYDALGDMMQTEIHALSINAYTEEEL
jgi:stress-induced morphogen